MNSMMMDFLLWAQDTAGSTGGGIPWRQIAPFLAAGAIGVVAWIVISSMTSGDEKAEERLEKFGNLQSGGAGPETALTTSERFQEILEKAAPTLAKPLIPQDEKSQSELKLRMLNCGYRGENAPMVFLGIKFATLIIGLIVSLIIFVQKYGFSSGSTWLYGLLSAGLCFYLPEIVLWLMIRMRKEQIFFGLPDALDLMVVCVESGLGLDAAMRKVCEEMDKTYPIISEEFSIANFQLQMGRPRREVLHDLGVRTGVDDMKSLSAILIQADKFGSSIAQALRVQSDSMRVRRKQMAEERAAKTAVQLIFPLVLFIFPAIFVVLVGPAAIKLIENFGKM